MPIIKAKELQRCVLRNGVPQDVLEDALGDLEGADYDTVLRAKDIARFEKQEFQRVRQQKLQALRETEAFEQLTGYQGDVREAFAGLFGRPTDEGRATGVSLEAHAQSIKDTVFGRMAQIMDRYRPRKFGFQYDQTGQTGIVRELFKEASGDPQAADFAKIIGDELEYLRQRWNRSGGDIAKLNRYGLPQEHDAAEIAAAGLDEWKAGIAPLLDLDVMEIDAADLDPLLEKIYNNIVGMTDEDMLPQNIGKSKKKIVADKGSESRVLHFKNADSWLAYQKRFGSRDPLGSIQNHINRMADNIALIEKFGPDPDTTFLKLKDHWSSAKGQEGRSVTSAGERMYTSFRTGPGVDNITAARRMGAIRNLIVSTMAGKIVISALTDLPIAYKRAVFAGLTRQRGIKMGMRMIQNIFTEADQKKVARLGIVADYSLSVNRASERFAETSLSGRWSRHISEFTFRASGLTRWTESAKAAFAMEFSYHIGDQAGKQWAEISPRLRYTFERYGIEERDWKAVQRAFRKDAGGNHLDPLKLDNEQLQVKVGSMIRQETRAAVLEPGVREESFFRKRAAGSFGGEVERSVAVFKSFPMTFLNTHIRTLGAKNLGKGERMAQAAFMLTVLPLFGWVASNTKKALRGETPPDPFEDSEAFWKASVEGMGQGIGLGIVTDFLFSDLNRFGSSPLGSAAGPVGSEIESMVRLAQAGAVEMFTDQDKNFRRQLVDKAVQYVPGSSLWWARLPAQRAIVDKAQQWADPQYLRKESQRQRRKEKDGATSGTWWPAGEPLP